MIADDIAIEIRRSGHEPIGPFAKLSTPHFSTSTCKGGRRLNSQIFF
ncbi:hypothetical protein [Bradyrhizobium sp. 192]|nr:hypothetical protein [Bradyrhizobium sp. 192]UPJ56922.1 hypothetical protein IVB24_30720 [Bradyrhizobium sp. 192]